MIEHVRAVTDKPIRYLTLTHYHAVRVLGASAYGASRIVMSEKARAMVAERGQEDWDERARPLSAPVPRPRGHPRPDLADR